MGRIDERFEGTEQAQEPEEMVARAFARCSNYPKERAGVMGLASGLVRASQRFGVPAERIIAECVNMSTYCPTDTDLLAVARSLKPEPHQGPRTCPLNICDGSGWRQVCHLHTLTTKGQASWTEKTIITREQFDQLATKVDWKTQMVYESRYRCKCHPPRGEDVEKKGKYA